MIVDKYLEKVSGQDLNLTHNFTILCSSIQWNSGEIFEKLYPGIAPTYFFGFTKDDEDLSSLSWMHPKNACEVAFRLYWKNPKDFYAWLSEQKKHIKEINTFYNFLTTDYINTGKFEDVKKQVSDLIESERACNAYGWFSMYGDVEFYKDVLKKNGSSIPLEKVDEILEEASNLKVNSFDQRNTAFVKSLNFTDVEEIYDNCEYMFSNFNGILEKQELLAQLKEMSQSEIEDFSDPIISIDDEEGKFKRFVYESMKMRDALRDYVGKTIAVCYRLTKRVAREAGLEEEHLDNCLLSEVFLGTEKFKSLVNDIRKRKDGFTILFNPDGSTESEYGNFDETYAKLGKYVAEYHAKDIDLDNINGTIACQGKVIGRAKIIMHLKKDFEKFEDGDILITGMTRPEFVPLMKRSAAIVTNEGGITCHAAIVSREMGKPCIIGTKVASEIFKDGDLIEVDANNGIVRKVEDKLTWNKDFYAKMDLFSMYLEADTSLSKEIKTIFKSPVKVGFRYVDKDYYYCVEDRNAIKKQLSENLIFNIENTNKVLKEVSNQFLDVCTNIHSLNLKNKINEELLQLYHRFCDVYAKTNAGWLHPLLIEELILSKIDEIIKSVIGPAGEFDLFNKVISSLLLSENESEMAKEKKELLNLIISNASDEELQKHADKYAYMGMVLLSGDPWTLGDLKKRISNIENPKEKLNELNHVCNDACKDRLSKIEDPEFWKLVELGRETSFLRTFHLEKTNEGCFYARRLFEEIAKRAELSYRDILHYTPQEIETFLINGNKVFKEEIQKRMGGYVVINKPDLKLYVGDGIDIFKEEHKTKLDDLNEIKGIIAQKGIVRGKAKVLLDPKDNDKVNSGDILIAELTTPNFIPAMEKASAFVTNIGGITSHAAIIAREMGKVCIVGTKHATQVFKDGDLVEVDANNGTVRKIKGEEKVANMNLPTEEECMQYFEKYKVPQNIKGHCKLVRKVAVFLANKLKGAGVEINVELVDKMALLHDLFKTATIENLGDHPHFDYTYTDEELFAWKQLREKYSHLHESEIFPLIFGEKYPELSKAIKNSSDFFKEDKSIEEQVSHYADWRVDDDKKVVSLKSRIDILRDRYKTRGEDYWERREEIILRKEKEIFSHLNFRPEQLAEMIQNG